MAQNASQTPLPRRFEYGSGVLKSPQRGAGGTGTFLRLKGRAEKADDAWDVPFDTRGSSNAKPCTAEFEGSNAHAGVTIAADDHAGRKRLCRHSARQAVCLSRASLLLDGRVAYRVECLRRAAATHRID